MFCCVYCKIFKSTYFEGHLRAAIFEQKRNRLQVLYKKNCFEKSYTIHKETVAQESVFNKITELEF